MGILTSNPWENAWIILGLIVAAFTTGAIVVGGAWVTWTDGIIGDTIARVILYIPIALGMFGFFADAVNGKYHYTPTSLTAMFGMGINKLLGSTVAGLVASAGNYVINRGRAAVPTAAPAGPVAPAPEIPIDVNPFAGGQRGGAVPCTLPGFEWLENTIAPQGLIVSMTVLFYILFEMVDTSQTSNIPAIGGVTLIVFLLQSFTYVRNGCLVGYDYGKWSLIIALAMSAVFAGVSYEIVKVINKALTSSASATPGTTPTAKPSEEIQVGQFLGEKSAPTDPNDQFVCEAYKDGELITSTIAS
jgi:hypothetical protein